MRATGLHTRYRIRHATAVAGLALTVVTLTGCTYLIPLFMLGEHKRTIPAEYDGLRNSRTMVLVWAGQETLFDYPYVRLELATYIADKLRNEVEGIELVEPARVEDHIERTLATAFDPAEVGRRFHADKVIYLELLEMRMRRPETPTLLQGRISASVAVFDTRADVDDPQRFELATVTVTYPERQPVLNNRGAAELVRQQTYINFAERTAQKFYEYEEEL
ncbi:MAG: hypothetical protein IID37_06925 [Planctomycetes bacterium]|nr:hypothetical protein [Planctomycetota bacterium]